MQAIPLQAVPVPAGGPGFSLLVPDPQWVEARFRRLQEAGEEPALPYWSRIWHSATALAGFLARRPELLQGKTVLELAAGLGLPSFVAARWAAAVTVSDYLPEAVDVLELNITASGRDNIKARLLDWNALPADLGADVLLLSDVNYAPAAFAQLLRIVNEFTERGTLVLLATPQRMMGAAFIAQLQPLLRERGEVTVAGTEITILVMGRAD